MTSMVQVEAPSLSPRPRRAPDAGFDVFRIKPDRGDAQSLSLLIEGEIIPRLVVAHSSSTFFPPAWGEAAVGPIDVETLVPLALEVEADALLGHVEAILARGVSVDAVLVDLLAPAARLLGRYWEEDRCDFVDVTMALWRMQEVVHELTARAPARRAGCERGHRALFAAMPGDQHSFGTVVIDELFRREGWLSERMGDPERSELLHRAAEAWFDLIGLTASCECQADAVGPLIVALRNISRNPRVCIMVGGRIFTADPGLAERVGADGTAPDAKLALRLADDLVRAREEEAAVLC